MKQTHIAILCTVPTFSVAQEIATELVTSELAACCNILPGVTSIYRWQGKVETDEELIMIIKSTEEKYKAIENSIKELHPYEVPEILSFQIKQGLGKYLHWINEVTKADYEQN